MRYTVDAGRQILRDGVRVATVYSKVQTGDREGLFPADADDFTHEIAKTLNLYPDMVALVRAVESVASTGMNEADRADLRKRSRALLAKIDGRIQA